jgi:iron complex transport system substrate-binding protein
VRALLAALLMLAGCGQAGDAMPPSIPPRPLIVSLNPCVDAVLVEVADPRQIGALSHWSRDPAASSIPQATARRFDVTGGTVEEVLALKPDLVLASTFIDPATRNALGELGVPVETFGIAATLAESEDQVRRVAALAGDPSAGERLIARMRAALDAATPEPGERSVDTVLWQPGGIVPGQGTLITDLLERTGFANGAAVRGYAQADYLPLEEVVVSPPELLLVAGSEAGQAHPLLDRLKQTRRERFDPSLLYCGGPTVIRAAGYLGALRRSMVEERR